MTEIKIATRSVWVVWVYCEEREQYEFCSAHADKAAAQARLLDYDGDDGGYIQSYELGKDYYG